MPRTIDVACSLRTSSSRHPWQGCQPVGDASLRTHFRKAGRAQSVWGRARSALAPHRACARLGSRRPRRQPPVVVPTRDLTLQVTGQLNSRVVSCISGKAQSALPNSQSGAAAAEYSSRNEHVCASAKSAASPWSSNRRQRVARGARRVLGTSPTTGLPHVRPNPSLKLTRYGRLCKPGLWHIVHHHSLGLHSLPLRAA